jgi:hypothetical protein
VLVVYEDIFHTISDTAVSTKRGHIGVFEVDEIEDNAPPLYACVGRPVCIVTSALQKLSWQVGAISPLFRLGGAI